MDGTHPGPMPAHGLRTGGNPGGKAVGGSGHIADDSPSDVELSGEPPADADPPSDVEPSSEPSPEADPLAPPDVESSGEPPPDAEPVDPPDDEPSGKPPSAPALETLPPHDAPAITTVPRKIAAATAGTLAHESFANLQGMSAGAPFNSISHWPLVDFRRCRSSQA
jgi:hypothetical protein